MVTLLAALLVPTAAAAAIGIDDLLAFHRISEPRISRRRLCRLHSHDAGIARKQEASGSSIVPTAGGAARQLTAGARMPAPVGRPTESASPSCSSRDGDNAVYTMPLTGGELQPDHQPLRRRRQHRLVARQQVHSPRRNVSGLQGRRVQHENAPESGARSRRTSPRPCSTATGRSGETASADTSSSSPWTAGRRRSLTPGADYDVPPLQREAARIRIAFSPDGKEIAFTADRGSDGSRENGDIFTVPADGAAPPKKTATGRFGARRPTPRRQVDRLPLAGKARASSLTAGA